MKKYMMGLAALAFAAAGMSAQAGSNLVVDGDFTQLSNGPGQIGLDTTVTGWSSAGYNYVMSDATNPVGSGNVALWDAANGGNNTWNGLAAAGGNFIAMDGEYSTGPVSQLITGLTTGQTYQLSFEYGFGQQEGFDGATIQGLTASMDSTAVATISSVDVDNHGFTGWTLETVTFQADAASETLSFLANGNLPVPPFAVVSNVNLVDVPEPAVWAMMLIGFGGLGAVARRRRSVLNAAVA